MRFLSPLVSDTRNAFLLFSAVVSGCDAHVIVSFSIIFHHLTYCFADEWQHLLRSIGSAADCSVRGISLVSASASSINTTPIVESSFRRLFMVARRPLDCRLTGISAVIVGAPLLLFHVAWAPHEKQATLISDIARLAQQNISLF